MKDCASSQVVSSAGRPVHWTNHLVIERLPFLMIVISNTLEGTQPKEPSSVIGGKVVVTESWSPIFFLSNET